MQNNLAVFTSLTQHLHRYFDDDELLHVKDTDELKEKLTLHIVYLLMYEMEKLLSILYRIDVDEHKVKLAFTQNEPERIAPQLTMLIIEREQQKALSRYKHRL